MIRRLRHACHVRFEGLTFAAYLGSKSWQVRSSKPNLQNIFLLLFRSAVKILSALISGQMFIYCSRLSESRFQSQTSLFGRHKYCQAGNKTFIERCCARYVAAYFGGWIWTILLTMPHSIAVNLAWPVLITKNDNVYGVLPLSNAMRLSVWLMIVHQVSHAESITGLRP